MDIVKSLKQVFSLRGELAVALDRLEPSEDRSKIDFGRITIGPQFDGAHGLAHERFYRSVYRRRFDRSRDHRCKLPGLFHELGGRQYIRVRTWPPHDLESYRHAVAG
jgi:hypothetical protein